MLVESNEHIAEFAGNCFFNISCTTLFLKILMAFDEAHKIRSDDKINTKISCYGKLSFIADTKYRL